MLEYLHKPKEGALDVKFALFRTTKENMPKFYENLFKTLAVGFGQEDINIKDVNIMSDRFPFTAFVNIGGFKKLIEDLKITSDGKITYGENNQLITKASSQIKGCLFN